MYILISSNQNAKGEKAMLFKDLKNGQKFIVKNPSEEAVSPISSICVKIKDHLVFADKELNKYYPIPFTAFVLNEYRPIRIDDLTEVIPVC